MGRKRVSTNFEQSLKELEALVERMEQGDLSLEESVKTFERGIELSRQCERALDEAEQKVQILTDKNGQTSTTTFPTDAE